jgi:hypothetical protein
MPKRKTETTTPKITPIIHSGSLEFDVVVVVVVVVVEECESSEVSSSTSELLFKRTLAKSTDASLALVIDSS